MEAAAPPPLAIPAVAAERKRRAAAVAATTAAASDGNTADAPRNKRPKSLLAAGPEEEKKDKKPAAAGHMPTPGFFYRRTLPASCTSYDSTAGVALFASSFRAGFANSHFHLMAQFRTQDEPAYCGLGTLAMTLNALAIDPKRVWKGVWRWFDETLLDCCKPLEEVKAGGITLEEFVCLALCNGASAASVRPAVAGAPAQAVAVPGARCGSSSSGCNAPTVATGSGGGGGGCGAGSSCGGGASCDGDGASAGATTGAAAVGSLEHFRAVVRRVTSQPVDKFTEVLVVSYNRRALGQSGGGHFSPVGAYDPASDQLLILDVARFKYPPHWVSLELVHRALQSLDSSTGRPRGWVEVRALPAEQPACCATSVLYNIHDVPRALAWVRASYAQLEWWLSAALLRRQGGRGRGVDGDGAGGGGAVAAALTGDGATGLGRAGSNSDSTSPGGSSDGGDGDEDEEEAARMLDAALTRFSGTLGRFLLAGDATVQFGRAAPAAAAATAVGDGGGGGGGRQCVCSAEKNHRETLQLIVKDLERTELFAVVQAWHAHALAERRRCRERGRRGGDGSSNGGGSATSLDVTGEFTAPAAPAAAAVPALAPPPALFSDESRRRCCGKPSCVGHGIGTSLPVAPDELVSVRWVPHALSLLLVALANHVLPAVPTTPPAGSVAAAVAAASSSRINSSSSSSSSSSSGGGGGAAPTATHTPGSGDVGAAAAAVPRLLRRLLAHGAYPPEEFPDLREEVGCVRRRVGTLLAAEAGGKGSSAP